MTKDLKQKSYMGFSLIEMLVTVFVFAVIAIISTQSLSNSLRSSTKTNSTLKVRENLDFTLSTMERLLHNAKSIDCVTSNAATLNYIDEYGNSASFVRATSGTDVYIASNSGAMNKRLTSPDVVVDSAGVLFSSDCINIPHSVYINLKARAKDISGSEGADYSASTKILLRNY
ncbi:hypothetical protein A2159_01730 [Candidatus Woesebacteria bacterium RBG_13_34_9]|uniref:Prepilin-type N-terminal cleavage/methylation domain-containing protein n=1 Tax=Candidatus Woesebacteria bacterium RBG_13_34_9 TaxID=1802477 RepID=A0A1F7X223_9BACT|nr:MAG: hypothetical protein A2159_01730 [Candidatus Woesebacteria bacterium RBG_13_34_9]